MRVNQELPELTGGGTPREPKTEPKTESKTAGRLESLDICRGWAILAVLFIHVSGHFLPVLHSAKSHTPPNEVWCALATLNLDSQWAVPCFLMLSAFVNALSLDKSRDIGRYARRRWQTAVIPYILWSAVYIVVNHARGQMPSLGPGHLLKLLLTGTAHFHLYFFVLVIEMYVLLPLLLPLFQRRPPFWGVMLSAIVLQAIVYGLNRFVFLHRFQSTIFWDILPVALGLWLFSQSTRWPEIFRKGIWAAGGVTVMAALVYTPLALATLRPPAQINTALYQAAQWFFTAGMSYLVLALSGALGQTRLTTLLSYFGAESLAIYVMHPLAIIVLDKLGLNKTMGAGLGMVLYYATCLGLPLAAAWVWNRGKMAMATHPATGTHPGASADPPNTK